MKIASNKYINLFSRFLILSHLEVDFVCVEKPPLREKKGGRVRKALNKAETGIFRLSVSGKKALRRKCYKKVVVKRRKKSTEGKSIKHSRLLIGIFFTISNSHLENGFLVLAFFVLGPPSPLSTLTTFSSIIIIIDHQTSLKMPLNATTMSQHLFFPFRAS